jgi:hypothetical protein
MALEMLAVLLGACVALLLVITGVHALVERLKRSAQLTGFAGSREDTLTAVLGAALSQALTRMSDEASGRSVNWQSGTEPKFELPKTIAEDVPTAGILAGLVEMLDRMLYRNLYTVSGTVHPVHEHRGAGLTMVVATRNGRTVDQVTIWEKDFLLKEAGEGAPVAVRYERLVLPAAVWLGYCKRLGFKENKPLPLHTRSWRSYALFALGEIVPDPVKERRLYELALDLDSINLGARLNLAALLLQRPSYEVPPEYGGQSVKDEGREGWGECLDAADAHLGVVAVLAEPNKEPIWYRARYMQAVVQIYRGTSPFQCPQAGRRAHAILDDLASKISVHRGDAALRGLLDALEQPIAVLDSTAKLIAKEPFQVPAPFGRPWRSATAEYNLACFFSRYAGSLKEDATKDDDTKRTAVVDAVRCLRRAIARDGAMAVEARVDPAFDAIRDDNDVFQALVKEPTKPAQAEEPTRYAVTLDPGPELISLARVL